MKLAIVIPLGVLAACFASATGGCAGETVVAIYGGSGEGGGYGGSSLDGWGGENLGANDVGGNRPDGPNCYDEAAGLGLNPAVIGGVEINQNVCTATQITDMFAACIGDTKTKESCDAFIAAAPENQACLDCAIGGGTQPPYPMPVAIVGDTYQYLSIYACQAEVAGLPECELPIQSLLFCGNTACQSCDMDDDEHYECLNYAINDLDVCGSIELPATCPPLFNATELPAECGGTATTFAAAFPILADFYCGAP